MYNSERHCTIFCNFRKIVLEFEIRTQMVRTTLCLNFFDKIQIIVLQVKKTKKRSIVY